MNSIAELVRISTPAAFIEGALVLPPKATGVVLFAHGSGSSRHSPRNNYVAKLLNNKGFGTLLMDLLTPAEDSDYRARFDIGLLTRRLIAATRWLKQQDYAKNLPIGYFGASTGAAAALQAAASEKSVGAVVSRGGRPDLAGDALEHVESPTLLIVGGDDHEVIVLNEEAFKQLAAIKKLAIIPGATHLFEEPGTLEQAASAAIQWFDKYLNETH
jgi:dienelactone hydrolase